MLQCNEKGKESLHQQGRTMTSDNNSASLASLLTLVKTLKRDSGRQAMSASQREARISDVIEKLASFQPLPIAAQAPMTLSAEDR